MGFRSRSRRPTVPPTRAWLLLGAALLSALACRPEPEGEPLTPALESLRESDFDARYGLEYWIGRLDARDRDDEWARAVEFCGEVEVESHPNCRAVRLLHTASKAGFPPPHEGRLVP